MGLDDDIRTAITRDRGGPHAQLLMRIAAERDGMKADLATAHALCDQAGVRLLALSDKYRAVVEQCADALVRVSALEIERDALRAELDAAAERLLAMQWRPVTDDEPAIGGTYLCRWQTDNPLPSTATAKRHDACDWRDNCDPDDDYGPPDFWMQLPPPPEGGR